MKEFILECESSCEYDEKLTQLGLTVVLKTFNSWIKEFYSQEFNLAKRLRTIRQIKPNISMFVKKNTA